MLSHSALGVTGTYSACRAHGISANKLMGLAEYAAEFAGLGYAAVVFDYRRWGASGRRPLYAPLALHGSSPVMAQRAPPGMLSTSLSNWMTTGQSSSMSGNSPSSIPTA